MNKPNPFCSSCPTAHNGINGRYCHIIRRFVEYDITPPCNNQNEKQL